MSEYVLNRTTARGKNCVYIGRSRCAFHWGNPFSHLKDSFAKVHVSTRDKAIECFREWMNGTKYQEIEPIRRKWMIQSISSLHGRYLMCYCAPLSCHGDILEEMATVAFMKNMRQERIVRMPEELEHFYLKRCVLLTDHPEAQKWNGLRDKSGEPMMVPKPYSIGEIVRCVMVSRMGDIGITNDLKVATGYDLRVQPDELEIIGD